MDFIPPSNNTFTIYTKSGCIGCLRAKNLLSELFITPLIIDCDNYLLEHRKEFLQIIKKLANIDEDKIVFFPLIFENGKYIGRYEDLAKLPNCLLLTTRS
jgi:glutaredoxin